MPVANALTERIKQQMEKLSEKQVVPKLAVVRVGEREDDLAYEKGIKKRFSAVNASFEVVALPDDSSQTLLEDTISSLNNDNTVNGILLFRPLPKSFSLERVKSLIAKDKDVDGMGIVNNAYVYEGNEEGYAPCTAQAVMELLDYYNIDLVGKKITVIGRSLVVGKPLAMLLLGRNATITLCHTKTLHIEDECKDADILIACAGSANMVDISFTNPQQIIIDVGINMAAGKLCGDVDYNAVACHVAGITPVPGGVGVVTASVLLKNTVNSAMKTWFRA
jgi:methylenetetrahydrofolate dehydrogenase (NADP+)/methenyltetrahydrofolate cyclohydrolase